ncbi:hypothetical protein GCM10009631_08130 [Corynebacterium glaucum]
MDQSPSGGSECITQWNGRLKFTQQMKNRRALAKSLSGGGGATLLLAFDVGSQLIWGLAVVALGDVAGTVDCVLVYIFEIA